LLLINSLFICKTNIQIVDFVNDQPNPELFYSAYLELDGSNMASILSFDSGSMAYLLDDKFDEYFSDEFPIFYKNKLHKGKHVPFDEVKSFHVSNEYFYRSAIDNALKNG
jgi:hypothetical protein